MATAGVSPVTFRRLLTRSVVTPVALLGALALVFLALVFYLVSVSRWVDHTDRVIAQANGLLKLLVDGETGLRGYLVTGDRLFLEPYENEERSIGPVFDELTQLVSDNPPQVERLKALRMSQADWQTYAKKIIALRKEGGDFQTPVRSGEGKRRMDAMRAQVAAFLQTEEDLRVARTRAVEWTTWLVVATSLGLALLLGTALAFFVRRQLVRATGSYQEAVVAAERRAEELRASEERFRATFEQAAVGIAEVQPDGRWLRVNRRLCEIVGFGPDELLQRTFQDITYPPDLEANMELVRRVMSGEANSYSMEKRYVRKDGSLVWANLTVALVRGPGGEPAYFISVVEDISGRKKAEEAAYRLTAIVQSSEDAIIGKMLDGTITNWNPGAARLYGYTAEEAVGSSIAMLLPPERPDELPSIMERLRRGERVESYETQRVAKDGRRIEVSLSVSPIKDDAGVVVGAAAIARDITEKKRATEALERFARRLEGLHEIDLAILGAQSLETLVAAALARLCKIVPCERALLALLDEGSGEVRVLLAAEDQNSGMVPSLRAEDLPVVETLRGGQAEPVEVVGPASPAMERLLGKRVGSLVAFRLQSNGDLRGVLYLAASEPGSFGPEQRIVGQEVANQFAIAVQQARLREQLRRHAEELERRVEERTDQLQETNAALEAFSYSISHDLRAPLRAMQGIAQALLEDYGDRLDPVGQDYARRVVASAQQMDTLIQDLLAYSRLSRADLYTQPVSLEAVVDEALGQLSGEVLHKEAQVSVERPLPQVVAHRPTLVQIIMNLLSNALKFVAPGARPQVRVWAEEQQRAVRLWVKDNGIGVAPEHRKRIFDVFERLHGDEAYPGTGIGLAIVRKGAERMGGRAGLEPVEDQGSRFWVELPKG